MTKTLVIADIHGSIDALIDVLTRAGAVDKNLDRVDGFHIIQLGDLLNMSPAGKPYRGFVSEDLKVLEYVLDKNWIDELLVGNHEIFYTHNLAVGHWNGMARYDELEPRMISKIINALDSSDDYFKAAAVAHDTLITHAGLHPYYYKSFYEGWKPEAIAENLNYQLLAHAVREETDHFPIVSDQGIFWQRPTDFWGTPLEFQQIVGHTPGFDNPRFDKDHNTWYIDTGLYIAGKGCGLIHEGTEDGWMEVPGNLDNLPLDDFMNVWGV